jgi:hypothetical protein
MAYVTGKTTALQTAVKAAAGIVAAEIAAGLLETAAEVDSRYAEIRDREFEVIAKQVDADNELFAANDDGGKKRSGGGRKAGGSGTVTLQEAMDTVVNWGVFKGLTLGEVFEMSAEEAAEYGYADKDGLPTKPGRQWIAWAAKNSDPKAQFIAKRCALIIENARAKSDAA